MCTQYFLLMSCWFYFIPAVSDIMSKLISLDAERVLTAAASYQGCLFIFDS